MNPHNAPPPPFQMGAPNQCQSLDEMSCPTDFFRKPIAYGAWVQIVNETEETRYLVDDFCQTPEGEILIGILPLANGSLGPRYYGPASLLCLWPNSPEDIEEIPELEDDLS